MSICGSARHSDPVPFSSVEGTADHASGSHVDEQIQRNRELQSWVALLQNVNTDRGHSCHHHVPGWRLALARVSMAGTHSVGLAPCFVRRKWRLRNTSVQALRTSAARLQSFSRATSYWTQVVVPSTGFRAMAKSYAPYAIKGNKASVEVASVTLSPHDATSYM